MSKTLLVVFGLVLVGYIVVLALLYVRQEALIFPGSKLPADYRFEFPVPFAEISIPVAGATLNALHFPRPRPRGVIFFLHGNGGNLDGWTENIQYYRQVNYDLFIFDYRGYGKSTGEYRQPAELMADVRAAWQVMRQRCGDIPVVIYGRSLGAALAAELATEVDAELLVLVSAFTSMVAMTRQHYPWVPSSLLRYPLRTDRIIDRSRSPVVLIHGSEDRFIPASHSGELYARLADGRGRMMIIEGAAHNDIHNFEAYLSYLESVLP